MDHLETTSGHFGNHLGSNWEQLAINWGLLGDCLGTTCTWGPHGNYLWTNFKLPQVLHRLQNKEKPIRTTFTLRFGSLKMIFECSIARCDVGLGRAIVQCQKNPLRKPKLSINRAILSAHFSAVKFCIGFFCWIGFFWFCIGFFCNWMLQLLLKIVAKNLNYASLHVCT